MALVREVFAAKSICGMAQRWYEVHDRFEMRIDRATSAEAYMAGETPLSDWLIGQKIRWCQIMYLRVRRSIASLNRYLLPPSSTYSSGPVVSGRSAMGKLIKSSAPKVKPYGTTCGLDLPECRE